MKINIAISFSLIGLVIPCGLIAQGKIELPVLEKRIEPVYPASIGSSLIEPAVVEIIIDTEGVPFSLKSLTSLPDNVVEAISKWRFRPAKNNGTAVGYRLPTLIPIHRLAEDLQTRRSQNRLKEIDDAFVGAKQLDAAAAARLEQQLISNPNDVGVRLTLLAFARMGADEETRQMRLRQILWFAANRPDHDVLAAPYAILTAPSVAEAVNYEQIRQVWLKQLVRYAADPAILDHATNFLRFSDPEIVERTLQPQVDETDRAAVFLGDLYAISALGATAVDPTSGNVSGAAEGSAKTPFAVKSRNALDETGDVRVILSALSTVGSAGFLLSRAGQVPADYADLCGKLLARAKEAYPATQQKCDLPPTPLPGATDQKTGGTVQPATLIKSARPSYPQEAKLRRITGTVTFRALIGKDGRIQKLELNSGPLALYKSARDAVLQWQYQPTTLDGAPVAVLTTIDVNFNLN